MWIEFCLFERMRTHVRVSLFRSKLAWTPKRSPDRSEFQLLLLIAVEPSRRWFGSVRMDESAAKNQF